MALAPCTGCASLDRPDVTEDRMGDVAEVATNLILDSDDPNYHRDLLRDLLRAMRCVDEAHAQTLLGMIRAEASLHELRWFVDRTLKDMQAAGCDDDGDTREQLEEMQERVGIGSGEPAFRPKVMDLQYLCDVAPYKVPPKPWTTVTDDDALVSHLISLYFTWDYPFYAFVDCNAFVHHMSLGNVNSDLCSPFLVNAMLANACHYSQYSEAYAIPGDIKTKGSDFLAEAERLMPSYQLERGRSVRLASLQATLLLYERYSMSGDDGLGYTMLHRAIEMGESLGIINSEDLDLNKLQMSDEMRSSIKRTAWGLFQVDSVVHTNFRKPSRVSRVSVERIARNETRPTDEWAPYPTGKPGMPSFLSQYFDEACRLSFIARDLSRHLYQDPRPHVDQYQGKKELEGKLREWEGQLPESFDPANRPPAHILLLWFVPTALARPPPLTHSQSCRMRYHSTMISLARDGFGVHHFFSPDGHTRPSLPTSERLQARATEQSLASARQISALVQLHRDQYGIGRSHPFITYAIMIALFTMLDHPAFDILDRDFLSLTSAFSVIACRSQVGRNLFHIFRESVPARGQEARVLASPDVSEEIKELFGWPRAPTGTKNGTANANANAKGKWDGYVDGLDKLGATDGGHGYAASGVRDMLHKYENLSLGQA
ncbi:transcription factor domain-containing protein [Aspergillus clavatus NRRL 1]|uniref:Xylanolytic transcriptional activator regulatory domain-containing protein n=1 Tax=Aspergillus clavatus (strain ATCC 1007 / CBS 513.65 / DSM 816 / NCTC 3887 / NRRL 1 / QM 1276 / 107) TaxID=344612 RepID=A1C5I1_ASPCL|nr:uncharacterized protein ACLA_003620 [Aspergillus clavatus NRRL 1]EAW14949.1 conserved hypothetical protein [Aspergillus clavatus NRRL 1]